MSQNLDDELDNILDSILKSVEKNKKPKQAQTQERVSSGSDTRDSEAPKKKRDVSNDASEGIDYYKVIGASPTDSQADILRKYKEKVTKYHPDKVRKYIEQYPPEERAKKEAMYAQQYALIREAEQFLKDPEKRKFYDMQRKNNRDLSFVDHRKDFENFMKLQDSSTTDGSKKLSEIAFKQKVTEMDAKHGFDSGKKYDKESYKLESKDFSRRLNDLQIERGQQEALCAKKDIFDGRVFNQVEFNKRFEADKKKREKQRKSKSDDRSIVKWEGVAAAYDHGASGGQYMSLDDDGKGYEDLYATGDDMDYAYARKLDSDDEESLSSLDDALLEDVDVSYVKGHDKDKHQVAKSYDELLKTRERDAAIFEGRKYDNTWGDVKANPFNPSHQMGEIIGTDMLDVKALDTDRKMKKEKIEAYKALIYNPDPNSCGK